MLRISRLTDYGTLVLAYLSSQPDAPVSASEVAAETGLALPTVSKLLKSLAKADLVQSTRGAQGGYRLARPASEISAAEIIDALEGPLQITECSASDHDCGLADVCSVGTAWQRINVAIRNALQDISLSELQLAKPPVPEFRFAGMPVVVESGD